MNMFLITQICINTPIFNGVTGVIILIFNMGWSDPVSFYSLITLCNNDFTVPPKYFLGIVTSWIVIANRFWTVDTCRKSMAFMARECSNCQLHNTCNKQSTVCWMPDLEDPSARVPFYMFSTWSPGMVQHSSCHFMHFKLKLCIPRNSIVKLNNRPKLKIGQCLVLISHCTQILFYSNFIPDSYF